MLKTRQGVPPRASRQESRPCDRRNTLLPTQRSTHTSPRRCLQWRPTSNIISVGRSAQLTSCYVKLRQSSQRALYLVKCYREGPFGRPRGSQVARAGEAVILEADMLVALLGGVGQVLAHLECVLPPLLHTRRCLSRGHVYARRHEPLA